MKIHPVVFAIHLEQANANDTFNHVVPPPPPIPVKGQEEHQIEKILEQKGTRCLVKWLHDDTPTNLQEDVPDLLKRFQDIWKRQERRHRSTGLGLAGRTAKGKGP
jgi:hypothetical protein